MRTIIGLLALTFVLWSGFLGKAKGYPVAGWLWGLFLGPIGLLIVFSLEWKTAISDTQESPTGDRDDPDSLEYIICPHCHRATVTTNPVCKDCGQLHGE